MSKCSRCNRQLKNPISVKMGMGKVCIAKQKEISKRQLSLYDPPETDKIILTPTTPVRLQRSRKKGFHLTSPNGLPNKYIGRGTKWGNNYKEGDTDEEGKRPLTRKQAVKMFKIYQLPIYTKQELEELRGKNLVCFCKVSDICHGDILLKAANKRKTRQ
jgi:hypothetical protein